MKLKQTLALISVLIVGLLVAYGMSLLQPIEPEALVEVDEELRGFVEKLYDFEPGVSGIYIRKQDGDYYLLEIYEDRTEGGGHWSVMKRSAKSVQEIEAGQYCAPSCAAVTNASVPVSIVRYCRTNPAIYDDGIIDRENGEAIPDPSPFCL